VDGRTDRYEEANSRLWNSANAPENSKTFLWEILLEESGICKYVNKSGDFLVCE